MTSKTDMQTVWYAIVLLWIISFWTGFAHAREPFNTELPMMCGDSTNLLNGLKEKYEEEIVFLTTGINNVGDELFHSLWINNETRTWSFVVLNKQKSLLCVIASGDKFNLFTPAGI